MKRTELATIILIAGISVTIAYFAANALLSGATKSNDTVQVIEEIDPTFNKDIIPVVFSETAINPTVRSEIK